MVFSESASNWDDEWICKFKNKYTNKPVFAPDELKNPDAIIVGERIQLASTTSRPEFNESR